MKAVVVCARKFDLMSLTIFVRTEKGFILFIDLERANIIQGILRASYAECFVDKVFIIDYFY